MVISVVSYESLVHIYLGNESQYDISPHTFSVSLDFA
jgi:hypothetical protein